MRDIPVQLLHAFVVFNDSSNISEAAQRLSVTQPAVSKQLKALEAFLPEALYTIAGRRKVLTPFGRELDARLRERLTGLQRLVEMTEAIHADPRKARIRIAGRRGVLDRLAPKLRFKGSLIFSEASNEQVVTSLLALDSEIGILHRVPNTSELIAKPLFKEEFQLVIPKGLFAARPVFGESLFTRLQMVPCLGYKPDDEILAAVLATQSMMLSQFRMIRATENYESLLQMVDSRMGWAILPTYLKPNAHRNWQLRLPERVLPSRPFFIAYRREYAHVAWFKELAAEIAAAFAAG